MKHDKVISIRRLTGRNRMGTILTAVIVLAVSAVSCVFFYRLIAATEQYIACQSAASDMAEASDYLTEQARLYVMTGDAAYMRNYFT